MKKLIVRTDGFEGFRRRSQERAKKLERGEFLEPAKILTFENAFPALTRGRIALYRKVKEKNMSITALAASLDGNAR